MIKKFVGGLRWRSGFFSLRNVFLPFAKITITASQIVFEVAGSRWVLKKEDLHRTMVKNRLFYKGVVFKHTDGNVPKTLVFWTSSADEVLQALKC